ncbi:MAG: hypothetical protein HQ521_21155 [Bacteroidetes bacterium]|nr:hypothetical protein [Bacteroidota bacterium]
MKRNLLVVTCLLFAFVIQAQTIEVKKNDIRLNFSGYLKNDYFWDTRQTVSAREGHFLLFPAPVDNDPDGKDINATPNFNFLSIQSRVRVDITGARALNADISGKLEADFFGQLNPNINLLRLRLAYINMNWGKTELRFGQDWIPMFITDCFPGTVSFNTGAPIQPFGRNPQIKLTQKFGKFKLIGILSSQRDYASRGADGATGTYMRNSGAPEFSVQLHYKSVNKEAGTAFVTGIGASYKTIKPTLETQSITYPDSTKYRYKTDELVGGMNGIVFLKYQAKKFTIKLEGIYGENIPDVLSIGGFVVSDIVDSLRGTVKYSPISTMSFWTDIHTNGKKWQFGVFAGYTQNLGAKENVSAPIAGQDLIYGFGTNIADLYRVSPRVIYNIDKLRFALELEYTVANYGSTYDAKGKPITLTEANNFRTLFAVYYFF